MKHIPGIFKDRRDFLLSVLWVTLLSAMLGSFVTRFFTSFGGG